MIKNDKVMRSYWEYNNVIADEYNQPGKFTALIGFDGALCRAGIILTG
jgi:hypothetical protein